MLGNTRALAPGACMSCRGLLRCRGIERNRRRVSWRILYGRSDASQLPQQFDAFHIPALLLNRHLAIGDSVALLCMVQLAGAGCAACGGAAALHSDSAYCFAQGWGGSSSGGQVHGRSACSTGGANISFSVPSTSRMPALGFWHQISAIICTNCVPIVSVTGGSAGGVGAGQCWHTASTARSRYTPGQDLRSSAARTF
jgi:hypothetical protein